MPLPFLLLWLLWKKNKLDLRHFVGHKAVTSLILDLGITELFFDTFGKKDALVLPDNDG